MRYSMTWMRWIGWATVVNPNNIVSSAADKILIIFTVLTNLIIFLSISIRPTLTTCQGYLGEGFRWYYQNNLYQIIYYVLLWIYFTITLNLLFYKSNQLLRKILDSLVISEKNSFAQQFTCINWSCQYPSKHFLLCLMYHSMLPCTF